MKLLFASLPMFALLCATGHGAETLDQNTYYACLKSEIAKSSGDRVQAIYAARDKCMAGTAKVIPPTSTVEKASPESDENAAR